MRPDPLTPITRARGFAVASAVFILVVLAALSAFMVSLSTTQHATSAMDVQGSRAYWAARSAAEWGALQVMAPADESGPTVFQNCPAVPATVSLPAYSNFVVSLTACERTPAAGHADDRGRNIVVYRMTAVASQGALGSQSYVERQFSLTVAKCKDPNAKLADGVTADPRNRC